jgi:sorting nexin-9/18/33
MLPGSSPSSPSLIRAKSTATPPTVTLASASTSPPSANATTSKATKTTLRPLSEFDAGLNSSAAWAANRAQAHDALSDDEGESSDEGEKYTRGRPARALYPFEGKSEFRELTVKAGDALTIIRDDAGDGWSLVRCGREVGLLPRTYYTVSVPVFNYFMENI